MAGRIARWADRLDDQSLASRLTVTRLFTLRALYPTIPSLYSAVLQDICRGLRTADRLAGRPVLDLWEVLVSYSL